jgi:hypothetical protein
VRNEPDDLKWQLPVSTVMSERLAIASTEPSIQSTKDGITIDVNDRHRQNLCASMRVNFDPNSNSTVKRDERCSMEKQLMSRISTEAGIQIDVND